MHECFEDMFYVAPKQNDEDEEGNENDEQYGEEEAAHQDSVESEGEAKERQRYRCYSNMYEDKALHTMILALGKDTLVTNKPTNYAKFFEKIDNNKAFQRGVREQGR